MANNCAETWHLLAVLLPNEAHAPYNIRPRRHNRQLIPKINKLYDSNFIQRILYKNLYWLTISTLIYVLLLGLYFITSLMLSCVLTAHNKRILYCIVLSPTKSEVHHVHGIMSLFYWTFSHSVAKFESVVRIYTRRPGDQQFSERTVVNCGISRVRRRPRSPCDPALHRSLSVISRHLPPDICDPPGTFTFRV